MIHLLKVNEWQLVQEAITVVLLGMENMTHFYKLIKIEEEYKVFFPTLVFLPSGKILMAVCIWTMLGPKYEILPSGS